MLTVDDRNGVEARLHTYICNLSYMPKEAYMTSCSFERAIELPKGACVGWILSHYMLQYQCGATWPIASQHILEIEIRSDS